jgi:hypothetical protein
LEEELDKVAVFSSMPFEVYSEYLTKEALEGLETSK